MEVLAPAGNEQMLKAAVAGGADAVYLATEKYGARAFAGNFSWDALQDAVRFCHLRGVKVHLTVNTLLKDEELQGAIDTVLRAAEIGVDAFIVQDLGLIDAIRRKAPSLVLHASTQMGVCNEYGAAFCEQMGFTRVVLARETLPDDIRKIKQNTTLEVEYFCQGALCVAFSGNCYYSSLVSGCSGNRGRCLQLCRKPYELEKQRAYHLSAKDICMLDEIQKLKALGVDSVKIEGRMRSPAYVFEAVRAYRAAIDGTPQKDSLDRLKRTFNRGDYCKAYFLNPTENVIFGDVQNHIGVPCGIVKSVKGNKATVSPTRQLHIGDGIKCLRKGKETGGGSVTRENEITFSGNVKAGDEARLTLDVELEKAALAADTRIPATLSIVLQKGKPCTLTLTAREQSVTVQSTDEVQPAQNRALTQNDVSIAVGTLGGTAFRLQDSQIILEPDSFLPVSILKTMRRQAIEELENKLLAPQTPPDVKPYTPPTWRIPAIKKGTVFVRTENAQVMQNVRFAYDEIIFAPTDYRDREMLIKECRAFTKMPWLDLPYISRGGDLDVLHGLLNLPVKGYIANNVTHISMFADYPLLLGLGLNRLNNGYKGAYIGSIEARTTDGIAYAYGKPPVMHFAHCPKRAHGGTCENCTGYAMTLTDEKGKALTLQRVKQHFCYGVLRFNEPINNIDLYRSQSRVIDLTACRFEEIQAVNAQMEGEPYSLSCMHGNAYRTLQ